MLHFAISCVLRHLLAILTAEHTFLLILGWSVLIVQHEALLFVKSCLVLLSLLILPLRTNHLRFTAVILLVEVVGFLVICHEVAILIECNHTNSSFEQRFVVKLVVIDCALGSYGTFIVRFHLVDVEIL